GNPRGVARTLGARRGARPPLRGVARRREGPSRRGARRGRGIVSRRHDAVDEAGRPIVAELGRAETPAETAERKAAASARRRSSQTALNLFIAVLASFVVVAFLYMVVVRPDRGPLYAPVDYLATAHDAGHAVEQPVVAPPLPE